MTRTVLTTTTAPGAIGPYSQAIVANGMVFTAGQTGIDPATRTFAGDTIEAQTEQTIRNIQAILEAAGSSLNNVVKTTVYLQDMDNFAAMNAVYGRFFAFQAPPARTTVQVARLPLDALVEIEAIALLD